MSLIHIAWRPYVTEVHQKIDDQGRLCFVKTRERDKGIIYDYCTRARKMGRPARRSDRP